MHIRVARAAPQPHAHTHTRARVCGRSLRFISLNSKKRFYEKRLSRNYFADNGKMRPFRTSKGNTFLLLVREGRKEEVNLVLVEFQQNF